MRAASVLAATMLVTCFACTYSVPGLAPDAGTDTAGELTEASVNDATFPDGNAAGSDGGGDATSGTGGDAGCTNGGILCSCISASNCSTATPICAQFADVGSDLEHAGFCTEPCCTSANCPAGSVCFSGGAGGSYCVDPSWLGRSSKLGSNTAIGGTSCTSNDQCRSGLCDGAGKCADTCCSFAESAAECASGSQCSFGTFPGVGSADKHFAAWCGPPGGADQEDAQCSSDDECAGGLCYTDTGGSPPYCVQPCSTSAECGSGVGCQLDAQGGDIYAACFPLSGEQGAEGAPCSGATGYQECLGGLCNAQGMCTNICFSDAVCTVSGWTCKPMLDDEYPPGSPTVLACGP